jgi:hypothetical protein
MNTNRLLFQPFAELSWRLEVRLLAYWELGIGSGFAVSCGILVRIPDTLVHACAHRFL